MEAPIDSNHFLITLKLTEENYLLWKSQFVSFLSSQKLLGFVDGSEERRSASTISIPSTDQLVRSWLLAYMSEDILRLVISCKTSHEVWSTLASHFNRISSSRVLLELERRFYNMKKENKPMLEYLRDFKSICDQLGSIGHPVTEEMKIFGLLEGLGRDYLTFTTVTEYSMASSHGTSYENVVSQLKRFDHRIRSYNDSPQVTHHLDFNNGYRGQGNYFSRGGNVKGNQQITHQGSVTPHQTRLIVLCLKSVDAVDT